MTGLLLKAHLKCKVGKATHPIIDQLMVQMNNL